MSQNAGVNFACCDCPNVDRFTVGILAEGRNAGAQSGRKRPQEHGKTVVFKPADLRGFRNGADKAGALAGS